MTAAALGGGVAVAAALWFAAAWLRILLMGRNLADYAASRGVSDPASFLARHVQAGGPNAPVIRVLQRWCGHYIPLYGRFGVVILLATWPIWLPRFDRSVRNHMRRACDRRWWVQ